jgi:hypothetical protein
MHRIVCTASNKLKKECHPGGLVSETYYAQYDQDEDLERLGFLSRILPGTDGFGRSERRGLITRNTSSYTSKVSGELAQERRGLSSKLTSGKLLYQRTYQLCKIWVRKGSDRETHKILTTNPMNVQP